MRGVVLTTWVASHGVAPRSNLGLAISVLCSEYHPPLINILRINIFNLLLSICSSNSIHCSLCKSASYSKPSSLSSQHERHDFRPESHLVCTLGIAACMWPCCRLEWARTSSFSVPKCHLLRTSFCYFCKAPAIPLVPCLFFKTCALIHYRPVPVLAALRPPVLPPPWKLPAPLKSILPPQLLPQLLKPPPKPLLKLPPPVPLQAPLNARLPTTTVTVTKKTPSASAL